MKADRRDDPRLLGEFALVVLAMLFISERSWKHHYVTVLLPITYLAYRAFDPRVARGARAVIAGALLLSTLLMATTSTEVGNLFAHGKGHESRAVQEADASEGDSIPRLLAKGQGHKVAQFYGMFFWSGVVLFVTTAWRVRVEGKSASPTRSESARYYPTPRAFRTRQSLEGRISAGP